MPGTPLGGEGGGFRVMWSYLTPANLIDMQRRSALREMGRRARALFAEGYVADADRVLDEMDARMADWARGKATRSTNDRR